MLVRLLMAGALVFALTAVAPAAYTGAAPSISEPPVSFTIVQSTHTVQVEYRSRSGALRQARVTVMPVERGGRAAWARNLSAVFFTAPRSTPGLGRHSLADRIIEVERDGDTFVGTGLVPAPEYLREFLLRSGSTTRGFLMPLSGNDDPPADDPPKDDPPKDGPPTDDPPTDDDCSCADCMDICDPWTCECGDSDPFPETEGFESSGRGVSFSI
ncbi:MAG: hypothetical protein AAF624_15805 [Bacteroidota bacterium]